MIQILTDEKIKREKLLKTNDNDILYFESSAKNNINIDIIFTTIAEKLPYNNSNIETLTFIETNKIKSSNCCYYL